MSGHQEREGADWQWTGEALEELLLGFPCPIEGWSSLAIGADQLFAETVLRMGGSLTTVVPGDWYEECYGTPEALARYRDLLGRGDVVALGGFEGEEAFLQAGRRIVEETDLLVAIWDGRPARGRGGTGDIVEYAVELGKLVRRIDPVRREHHDLGKG